MRWPRKNDARLDRGAPRRDGRRPAASSRASTWSRSPAAAESLVGVAVIPVSAVPLEIELGAYELGDDGAVEERGRATETVRVPLAHTEGGLTASMTRGALAAGHDPHVRPARPHHARVVLRLRRRGRRGRPRALGRVRAARDAASGSRRRTTPSLSKRARLRGVKTHVVGPMCHVLWQWTTGDAVGPNMMTRNSYALNMALRDAARAREARARGPRGEHGRRQEAVRRVLPVGPRQDRARRGVPVGRADPPRAAHDGGRSRGALVGGHARRGRERHAVGRVHARVGDRRGLRGDGPGSRHGRHELDGARHRRGASRAACRRRSASAGSRSAPSAAARPCRRPATGSRRSAARAAARSTASRRSSPRPRCALEISASAAMATAGSENFFQAHHERGGLAVIALVFRYEVRDTESFEAAYGPERRVGAVLPAGRRLHRHRAAARRRGARALPRDRPLGVRATPTTRSSRRTRRSTCAAATSRASTTSRSSASGRSRTSGMQKIPPHHDPACWGCGDNPTGLQPAGAGRRGPDRVRGVLLVRRATPGRPGHRARRARLGGARRGVRAARDLVRVPGRDGAHVRPLPPARADQHRAAAARPASTTRAAGASTSTGAIIDGDQPLAEARVALLHVPLEHFLSTPEGRAAAERWRA